MEATWSNMVQTDQTTLGGVCLAIDINAYSLSP